MVASTLMRGLASCFLLAPWAMLLAAWLAASGTAQAQAPLGSLNAMALAWAQGDFRSPLICELDKTPRRALRRIRISAGPRASHRPMDRLVFYDLEAPTETRCHNETGRVEPNIVGTLSIVHESRNDRPDLAEHDFAQELRRTGGFSFRVASGLLRIGEPGAPREELETVDFKGGSLTLRTVKRGSDAYRRLADLPALRKLGMELVAPDATRVELDLVQLHTP